LKFPVSLKVIMNKGKPYGIKAVTHGGAKNNHAPESKNPSAKMTSLIPQRLDNHRSFYRPVRETKE